VPFTGFPETTTQFLAELEQHNDREWFEAHTDVAETAVIAPAKAFVEALGARLHALDPKIHAVPRVRGSIKSFERRRRFAKHPLPPYKPNLDVWFWSGPRRAWDNSGFFLRLTPTRLILAAGMIEFQKETLARYRERVLDPAEGAALTTLVDELRASGYVVGGESYKRPPRGVPADHPHAALSKHGGLFASTGELDHPSELRTPAFVDFTFAHFARMGALHAWLVAMRG
jgi:uncharacterized protein (TIGR02453 family)